METYVGFDSAWADSPKTQVLFVPSASREKQVLRFHEPVLAGFAQALEFVKDVRSESDYTLIALDQPTRVPNQGGMRPVERLAASLISWVGGGVQPANRKKVGMFCDDAPIWSFLTKLDALEDPIKARESQSGLYLMEVFPALAKISFGNEFFARNGQPKYNPQHKKPSYAPDWSRVVDAAAYEAEMLRCVDLQKWLQGMREPEGRRKEDHDKLDAAICLLTALLWRRSPQNCLFLGDLTNGYMVTPTSASVLEYLVRKANAFRVPLRSGRDL